MSANSKDTIYIDIDDEITSIIEKVKSSPQKIVALVLPKRATVFQSIVNMKLLKRSADDVKKRVVLITSEAGLLPLAGVVGVHVAKTLQSKPAIPPAPSSPEESKEIADEVNEAEEEPIDASKPVGDLAGLPASEEETIEVDNDEPTTAAKAGEAAKGKKLNKKLKIPNFNKFRLRLVLGALAFILLLVGWYFANFVMPKATVVIKTDTENIESSLKFTSSPNTQDFNLENAVVPAVKKELKNSEGQKTPATGQKNVGKKAEGTVRLINCSQADKLSDTVRTVPAGTTVNSGGLSFILAEAVQVEPSSFIGSSCQKNKKSVPVNVVAKESGDNYNLSARDYSVAGYASMTAQGSDMAGGTNQIVKVVSQQDIDSLKQKIVDGFTGTAKERLKQQLLAEGFIALEDTLQVGQPVVVNTPNANDEANEVNVNVTMTFTMQGVKEEHLLELVKKNIADKIDSERQEILDNGLGKAIFQIDARQDNGDTGYNLQTLVVAGPNIDKEALKKEIAGKKRGEAENIIRNRPGVKDVSVDYSPFWVAKTPGKSSKVTVTIESTSTGETDDANDDE